MKSLPVIAALFGVLAPLLANAANPAALPPEQLETVLAEIVRDAIPHEYEKKKNWGHTKRITTGLAVHGKLRSLSIKRRKKEVDHGLWKHYRVRILDPEKTLAVSVNELRSDGPGRAACTLMVEARLAGWARVRHYNRGVHLGTLTVNGHSTVRIALECEVGFGVVQGKYLPAFQIDPKVTATRVAIKDFHLDRVGEIGGDVAKEIGRGLKHVIEDQLDGPKLTKKINASIHRKRDRLRLDFSTLAATSP